MSTTSPRPARTLAMSTHARRRLTQRRITDQDVREAIFEGLVFRQDEGRRRYEGRNGVTVVTDSMVSVLVTAFRHRRTPASRPTSPQQSGARGAADRGARTLFALCPCCGVVPRSGGHCACS